MANLKRRPDKDLNHDNWDEEDAPEEKGEFKRANEEDLRSRKILKPRRNFAMGNSEAAGGPSNPFGSFSFNAAAPVAIGASTSATGFTFGLPVSSSAVGSSDAATAGGTGSLFKIVGITPSSEPPTKASADSSTPEPRVIPTVTVSPSAENEPEVVIVSDSDGITEESSNSSSLPWNVSARQKDDSNAVDSNNLLGIADADPNNPSWLDDLDEKEASAASSEAVQQSSRDFINTEQEQNQNQTRTRHPATSSRAPADSSESSSTNNSNHLTHFNFGGTTFGNPNVFQTFQPNNNPPSSTTTAAPNQNQSSAVTSPQSSGIVRSSLDDDADYENDTTSSSNKLPSEGGNENEAYADECDGGEDREAEAEIIGVVDANEEREAEGVDS